MKQTLKWYIVDKEYVRYLRKADNRVQYSEYSNKLKPYIGIVLTIHDFDYYVPISSVGNKPQKIEKYRKMKDDIDIVKLYDNNNRLLSVLNLNNMIPIQSKNAKPLKYDEIDNYRQFCNFTDKKKYIYFLQIELAILRKNADTISYKATKLYHEKSKNEFSKISKRTCDLKLLEEKCIEYNKR